MKPVLFSLSKSTPQVTDASPLYSATFPLKAGSAANTELNEKVGFLYNTYAFLGMTELPAYADTNAHKAYNGAQGICPVGWHIPTAAEWNTLVSFGTSSVIWGITSGENASALFYETYEYIQSSSTKSTSHTSIVKANECGFNFYPVGAVTSSAAAPYGTAVAKSPEEFKDMFGLSYFASSSICGLGTAASPDVKLFAAMTTMSNTTTYSHGRLSLAQLSGPKYAVSVRCVKNKVAE